MAETTSTALDGCAVVMAHPDDEALWASGALAGAERIILCYGAIPGNEGASHNRQAGMAAYPLAGAEHLAIDEAGVFGAAGWPLPAEVPAGVRCRQGAEQYEANFRRLLDLLRDRLRDSRVVVTHNPWGEYGHEEHIQVSRAVAHLQGEIGFAVYVSGYVANTTMLLMQRHLARLGPELKVAVDAERAQTLRDHYLHHGCWTWAREYSWPDHDIFFALRPEVAPNTKPEPAQTRPFNTIWLDSPLQLSVTVNPFG